MKNTKLLLTVYKNKRTGKTVFKYPFATYGCLAPHEIAVTDEPAKPPFRGVNKNNLREQGKREVEI